MKCIHLVIDDITMMQELFTKRKTAFTFSLKMMVNLSFITLE